MKGVTPPNCGSAPGASPGGVRCHTPAPVPGLSSAFASKLSLARQASMRSATALPTAMPSAFERSSPIFASDWASAVSSAAFCAGTSAARTPCAAVATAASFEAPAAASTGKR